MSNLKLTYLDKLIHNIYLLNEIMLQHKGKLSKIDNKENLEHISSSVQKLIKIVNLLSSITNLKVNEIDLQLEELDLIDLVGQEIKYYQKLYTTNHNLKIELNSKASNRKAKIDKFWFKQLLANLITNAINHCEKGLIKVYTDIITKNEIDYFCFIVSDEGCGIAENELETIFRPLERGTHSTGKISGSGIGSQLLKKLQKPMGEAFWLKII